MVSNNESKLYYEDETAGYIYRAEQLKQIQEFIKKEQQKSVISRRKYFSLDFSSICEYKESIRSYREELKQMLGWPLLLYSETLPNPKADLVFVANDALGEIYRINITTIANLTTYGLLFIPHKKGSLPLVIAQHGGGGTPEKCSGFFGSDNYNDMVRRMLRKGVVVFVPQLLLWSEEKTGPGHNRQFIDTQLKQLGGSITALEIFSIQRCLDHLITRPDIDESKVGMMGLSYGGFYTLFTAAIDLRIKAVLSSCFFNNRYEHPWSDWVWFDSANKFLDAEICAMICPRPLYIEVGKNDELFDVRSAREEFEKVKETYEKIGVISNLEFCEFEGSHEFNKDNNGIEFLYNNLI